MSRFHCPVCKTAMDLPDGLPMTSICCPACGEEFAPSEAAPPPEGAVPAPAPAPPPGPVACRGDTQAITQAMPTADAAPGGSARARAPDPIGAYRGDTLAFVRPGTPPPPEAPRASGPPAGQEGEQFGTFDLLEKIGSSDVAVTYRARRRAQGDVVALKVLAPGPTATGEEIASLVERARAASKLRHEGIVRIIEVRRRDDTDYVASEFVAGRALADVLEAGGPEIGEAVEMARAVAWALDYAHGAGVVHGNLKPSNVIVDELGRPRLTDFGLARELWRLSPGDLRAAAARARDLPLYTAPEQLRGEPPTPRSDVYGLGALLYHMTARRPPFEGRDVFELVLEIDRGRPAPPAAVNMRVPPAVSAIVMKCLEPEPRHRFATAGDLASEIERFLHGQRIRTRPPGAGTRAARSLALRWKAAVAVLCLSGAAAAGGWFAARSAPLPEGVASLAGPLSGARAAMRAADDLARRGLWEEAGRKLAALEAREDLPAGLRSAAAARLGVAHFRRGGHREAADCFSRAIGIRPGGDAGLHYLYAVALWHSGGDPKRVASELGETLRLDPARGESPDFLYQYGRACELAGDAAGARGAFERVRALDPAFRRELVSAHLGKLAP